MFCSHCGSELADGAYICVKCGRLVNNNQKESKANRLVDADDAMGCDKRLTVFFIITFVMSCLMLILVMLSVIFAEFDKYYKIIDVFYPTAMISFLHSPVCLGIGIAQLVIGRKTTGMLKLLVVANFIFCMSMVVLGVCTFISII